jgi:TPP-dependent pyruvate/acetoin dehydrogenase alpha subunit
VAAKRWRDADPIPRFAAYLESLGATTLEAERAQAAAAIAEAVQFARDSALPPVESVATGIFAE